jgi:uncharacterized protein (DUF1501 family)
MPLANQPARLSRRQLLRVGGIGMVGLGLADLLRAGAPAPAQASPPTDMSCIFIVQAGGPSQLDTWDPKPGAPAEYRGPYQSIATRLPGLRVCELMPRLAGLADRYCLIRSMSHPNGDHQSAMHTFLGGSTRPAPDAVYFGSVLARTRPAVCNVPSYVWLQDLEGSSGVGKRYLGGGFLGPSCAPLRVGNGLDNPSAPDFRVQVFDGPRGLTPEQLDRRHRLLSELDPAGNAPAGATLRRLQERAFDLVTGTEARRAFDLGQEPAAVRDRYGRNPLGQNLLMARRLIEAGVRLVSVTAFTGTPDPKQYWDVNMWDMHGNGSDIFGTGYNSLGYALPRFDQALSALLEDLSERGLLGTTLVAALGEMGRTPRINKGPKGLGRDHWPHCYPALLAGAGIRGGVVYGSSDRSAAYPRDNPVSPETFSATVYHALGVPPETRLSPDGFTRPASTGHPILDLFS